MADYRGTIRDLGKQLAGLANGDKEVVGLSLGRGVTSEIRRDGSEILYVNGRPVVYTPAPKSRWVIPDKPERQV